MQAFPSAADFEAFLDREHASAPGIYVKLAKKASCIPSISSAEAVEVALCYGWIDGRANSIDDVWWTARYTPRRAKSIWSQKNVGTIARLIAEGRMRPAGLATVEAAKADGRWDRAYAGPATMVEPEDLKTTLAESPAAEAVWKSLSKSEKYASLHRIETASKNNRAKSVAVVVQMLAAGQQLGATSSAKTTKKKAKSGSGIKKAIKTESVKSTLRREEAVAPRRAGLRQRKPCVH